jgi:hypothetical protein
MSHKVIALRDTFLYICIRGYRWDGIKIKIKIKGNSSEDIIQSNQIQCMSKQTLYIFSSFFLSFVDRESPGQRKVKVMSRRGLIWWWHIWSLSPCPPFLAQSLAKLVELMRNWCRGGNDNETEKWDWMLLVK